MLSANQNLLRSRPNLPHSRPQCARHSNFFTNLRRKILCNIGTKLFVYHASNNYLRGIKRGTHRRRHLSQKKTFSPFLFVCSCLLQTLFVWLPDAWLQRQPWQRDSWQALQAEGTAPRCRSPYPPPSSPSPCPPCWTPSRTRRQCRAELTGRAPLLSRLACPQIINPTGGAGRLY